MADDLHEQIRDALGSAIENAVGEHEKGFATKWVVNVESVAPDGERGVWCFASDGSTSWDVLGLLQHALLQQQAQVLESRD